MNGIKFEGLEDIIRRLETIEDVERFKQNMGKACALVERSARQNAPKDTGNLRRSITSKVVTNQGVVQGIVFTPTEYAPYVEYGTGLFAEEGGRQDVPWIYQDDEGEWHVTSGQQPKPFMRPALDDNRENILRILKEGLIND